MSDKTKIFYEVPEGSVFSPVLFSIYVNDRSCFLPNCETIQYADDTQFIRTGKTDLEDMKQKSEETITLAKIYFHKNGLMLNTKKTQCCLCPKGELCFYQRFLLTLTCRWTAM